MATKIVVIMILAAALLVTHSSCKSVERSDHWCGNITDGTWGKCDPGRCCSHWCYCGASYYYCHTGQCYPYTVPPGASTSETAGGGLLNATHNHYMDHVHDDDDDKHHMIKATYRRNASSWSSSSSLSCATSLSRLPQLPSQDMYPWAAFGAGFRDNNVTNCGRCLKVTKLGGKGVHHQVKVRIVHERNNQGLELDLHTFSQLDTDGRGDIDGHLMVEYQFESC